MLTDFLNAMHRPGSPERSHMQGPMSFKQFLMNQEDDPSPEEAQQRYQAYLVDFHGSEIKAEFAQNRNDERWVWMAACQLQHFQQTSWQSISRAGQSGTLSTLSSLTASNLQSAPWSTRWWTFHWSTCAHCKTHTRFNDPGS